jgi:YggT family protein
MINIIIKLIDILSQVLVFLVIVSVILSYFVPPYHSVRRAIDRIIEPMLSPIRRIVPTVGLFDFSPLVLIILIQILSFALTRLLYAF